MHVGVMTVPMFASWLHSPAGPLPQTPASGVADESGISFASAPASSEPAGQMQMQEGCSLSYGGAPTQGCPLDVYPEPTSISHGLPIVQGGFRSTCPPQATATSTMDAMNEAAPTRIGGRIRPWRGATASRRSRTQPRDPSSLGVVPRNGPRNGTLWHGRTPKRFQALGIAGVAARESPQRFVIEAALLGSA